MMIFPVDFIAADKFAPDANTQPADLKTGIPDGWEGLDAGPKSIELYRKAILDSKTIVWNGPAGVFEFGTIFYRKRGCPRCGGTGFKGRIGVYQLLAMSERLQTLAASKATREEIERAALEEGMRTLWDDGLSKVAAGLTSLEELARVTV